MKLRKMALLGTIALALAPLEVAAQDANACIQFRRVSSQKAIDDLTVVVSLPAKQYRKITMAMTCRGMKREGSITVGKDPVCAGDAITVRNENGYCVIGEIAALEEAEAKQLISQR